VNLVKIAAVTLPFYFILGLLPVLLCLEGLWDIHVMFCKLNLLPIEVKLFILLDKQIMGRFNKTSISRKESTFDTSFRCRIEHKKLKVVC